MTTKKKYWEPAYKKDKYHKPFDIDQYRGYDSAANDYTGYDNDLYNSDGTLKQGSFFDDSYDYESTYSRTGAASSWWRSKFNYGNDYGYSYSGYGSYSSTKVSERDQERERLRKELKDIGRTVNSVRNTLGARNREKNLKVAWAGTQIANRTNSHLDTNNMTNRSTIYLSPDPLTKKDTIKPDWSEDQKRDALIGEALTLTSMKRTLQPNNVKRIMEASYVASEVINDPSLIEESEMAKNRIRLIARELWKSVETYKAQTELLQYYRGCRPYFAAFLAFYSDKGYRDSIQEKLNGEGASIDGAVHKVSAFAAAAALAWNVNHINVAQDQIIPPEGDVEDIMLEAYEIVVDALDMRSTLQRWEATVEAARVLSQLDEDNEDKDKDIDLLDNPKNGNTGNLFGEGITNDSGIQGSEEVEAEEEVDGDTASKGFTEMSKNTRFNFVTKEMMLDEGHERHRNGWAFNPCASRLGMQGEFCDYLKGDPEHPVMKGSLLYSRDESLEEGWDRIIPGSMELLREMNSRILRVLRENLEINAVANILPEYGMRSGRITGNSLWKVPTDLHDNDRVFHRKIEQGETREVTIGILVDFSGSMGGTEIGVTKRIVLLLHDLLAHFPMVDFQLFGHADNYGGNQIMQFASIEEFIATSVSGGTNEGTALSRTALEFMKQNKRRDRKLLLAIGDGHSNHEEIQKSVNLIRRVGIELYDILINGDVRSATESYGRGKVCGVHSSFYSYMPEEAKEKLLAAGFQEGDQGGKMMEHQFLAILRPWLTKILNQLYSMGGI